MDSVLARLEDGGERFGRWLNDHLPAGTLTTLLVLLLALILGFPGGLSTWLVILPLVLLSCNVLSHHVSYRRFESFNRRLGEGSTATLFAGDRERVLTKRLGYWCDDDGAYTDEELRALGSGTILYSTAPPKGKAEMR